MSLEAQRHCPTCRASRTFVQPDCGEGHGADCPEWVCVDCGSAYLVGFVVEPVAAPAPAAWVA